jgi:GABA(A) receptor-associated protein
MNILQNYIITGKSILEEYKKREIETKTFQNENNFEKRLNESINIMKEYPNRIPIIVERYDKSLPQINRKKYLVPGDLSMVNLTYIIRKRLKLTPEKSFFMFINEKIIPMTKDLYFVYEKHKENDGFLYVKYCEENTFG